MSGFGFGGGFGQNNQQQQSTGFGGFGQTANTTNTGFGAPASTGFGATQNNTGGGLFGASTGGGFGNTGGFGSSTGAFGSAAPKPAFGATATTSSLFGGGSTTSAPAFGGGGGGFGSNTASTGFGANNNTGGGLFGAPKPATTGFGAPASTGFGQPATTSAFGGSAGFGATPAATAECTGTASVAYQSHTEKEGTANQQVKYENICCQAPYQKFSQEELRLADYNAGRRYASGGQPGAFGQSTGFGGFGNTQSTPSFSVTPAATGGGLFGNTQSNTASNPFGQTSTANTGFGSTNNNTGGLFGSAAKPASTGLFGAPASTGFGAAAPSTGFGAQPATSGFGSNTGTTSSLFGNNSSTQNKGLFGAAPASTTSAFGSNTNTTGFGSQPASNPFGQTQQQPAASNPFGAPAATQQPATSSPFGGGGFGQQQNTSTSGGLFGAAKPATTSLFGNTSTAAPATGGGLFGNTSSTPATGGFGQSTAAPASGGLFGAKPAAPAGGGLFGNTSTQQNTSGTSGGLFGSAFGQNQQQQQPQNTGGGLFGGLGQQQQQNTNTSGGLFGAKPATTSLFGNTNQQQNNTGTTGGLFGGGNTFGSTQNQQQPQNSGGSLFGGSSLFGGGQQNQNQNQQQQPQQQQNGSFTTSINDPTAFGNSMFSTLATPDQGNPGPLATPLSSLSKQKKAGVIPLYKLNPSSGSRIGTPQKRGFGFSYSTYGTPNAMSSATSTPGGYGNSILGHSLGSNKLIKSTSTSSLRNTFNSSFNREDSILAPGAFSQSPSSRYNSSTGSMKRLVIDRGIRGDLFTPPSKKDNGILKKRVSFEANAPAGNANGNAPSPLKQVHTNGESNAQENGFLRSSPRSTNVDVAKTIETPEMEQVKGNELAIVPEESSPSQAVSPYNHPDQQAGEYWMKPSKEEILSMNRTQRQKVNGFSVGRQGVGAVHFNAPVDLSNVDLDNFFGKVVILETRSATVYPDASLKPPMGQGLNVPSTIELENSWPRHDMSRSKRAENAKQVLSKHARRLQKVHNTEFVSYDENRGIWTFKVPHFTTYGLDYDSDEDEEMAQDDMDEEMPQTPAYNDATPRASHENSFVSQSGGSGYTESELEDDTFDFKKRKMFPGAFDRSGAIDDDEDIGADYNEMSERRQSFLGNRSVGSVSGDDVDEPMDHDVSEGNELVRVESNEMAGSFPQLDATAELQHQDLGDDEDARVPPTPGGILRARMRLEQTSGTPLRKKVQFAEDNEDWAAMLKQTVSPQKRDRAELRRIRDDETDAEFSASPLKASMAAKNMMVSDGRGFATSIDLMHSLFGETKSPMKAPRVTEKPRGQGFEWPYKKTSKDVSENLNEKERAYHDSVKPSWGPDGTLLYQPPTDNFQNEFPKDQLIHHTALLTTRSNAGDIRLSIVKADANPAFLSYQKQIAAVETKDGVPQARMSLPFSFKDFINDSDPRDPALIHEKLVWELASILFDELAIPDDLKNFPAAFKFLRKDLLCAFWEKLVEPASVKQINTAQTSEEKAVAALAGHKIVDACSELLAGKNFHLATLVALLDGNEDVRESVTEQLNIWRDSRALSEINQPIRAIYEILAGNVCVCEGSKKGAPIEDRIDTFVISKHFGLDWRQTFGLRLWYAISNTDEIKSAVAKFSTDLSLDKEGSKPYAWYVEQNISPLWDDQHMEDREDLLWGLLKLYSDNKTDLQSVIRPENSQLSPLNMRLSWQLSQALTAAGKASYGTAADEKADALTLSFASQLANIGHWLDAIFVLLHLSNASARSKAIQDQLALNAGGIGNQESEAFNTLIDKYKIPAAWVWSAKALYMRAVAKDAKKEVDCLIHAEAYDEAHRTLCRDVAPTAIIERDYETLEALLEGFAGKQIGVTDWELGGGVYGDYLKLVKQQGLGKANAGAVQLAERLVTSLPAMVGSARSVGFLQRVAAQEMSAVVAEVMAEHGRAELATGKALDHSKILRLPMTEDRYLKHTADLSLDYYRTVLTGMAR